jgi:hypothetical protein
MKKIVTIAIAIFVSIMVITAFSRFARADGTTIPAIMTDKLDYSPSETVTVTGWSFNANQSYAIPVIRPSGSIVTGDGSFTPGWDNITTDENGNFTYLYQLDGVLGSYTIRVYLSTWTGDLAETPLATTLFTDTTHINTSTTLNAISSPLVAGQTYSFSGTVSATPSVPNGATVNLKYDTDSHGSYPSVAGTTTTSGGSGGFSGTFTAPSAGTYYFIASFPDYDVGSTRWDKNSSDYRGPITVSQGYQLTVNTNPAGIDSTTGSGTYASGAVVSISAPEYQDIVAGSSRYHFTGWTGTLIADPTAYSTSVTMGAAAKTVTANYETQYNLTVNTNPAVVDSTSGSGWYKSGDTPAISAPEYQDIVAGSSRYHFTGWTGTLIADPTAYSTSVTMGAAAKTVTANYETQYKVTFDANVPVTVPVDEWVKSGGSAVGTFSSPQYNVANTIKYVWVSDNRSAIIEPSLIHGVFDTYYKVTFDANVPVTVPVDEWVKSGGSAVGTFSSPQYNVANTIKYVWVSDNRSAIIEPSLIHGVFDTYYKVTFDANVPVTVPVDEWVKSGGSAVGTFSSPQYNVANTIKYVWVSDNRSAIIEPSLIHGVFDTYYKVTFKQTGSGVAPTVTYNIDSGSDVTNTVEFSVWVGSGSSIAYSYESPVAGAAGTQYVLTGTSPTSPQTVSSAFDVIGTYKTQYKQTFGSSGLSGDATGNLVSFSVTGGSYSGATSPIGLSGGFIWVDDGATVDYTFVDPVTSSVTGKQYRLDSITDPDTGYTVSSAHTLTGNYVVQWKVTFDQTGVSNDFSETVMTVNGFDYDRDGVSFWADDGNVTTFSYASPLVVTADVKQYVLTGVTGNTTSTSLTVSAETTVTGAYKTQFYVTFAQSGVGIDFSGDVMKVDGTNYTRAGTSFWWYDASSHSFEFYSPLAVGTNKQYKWDTTSGLSTVQSDASFSVTQGGSITGNYGATVLTYTGDVSGEYSDPVTVSATLKYDSTGVPGVTITFTIGTQSATATTNSAGLASTSIILTQPAGNYKVNATCAGASGTTLFDEKDFTIDKEIVTIIYTGDTFVWTAGPTITTAPVRLSANLTQEDAYLGDLTKARVRFELFKSTNMGTTPDIIVGNIPVSASGDGSIGVALTTRTLAIDVWTIIVKIEPTNAYWTQDDVGEGLLTIDAGTAEQKVTGGGWIPDAESMNGKDNFGFVVTYLKNGAPKGNFVFMFKSSDGYTYVVKSNSWSKGGLSFSSINKAFFTGKCNIFRIDRATGEVTTYMSCCKFAVDITDGDLVTPRVTDTIAITIFGSGGSIWKQMGTFSGQIPLGGGNLVVHSK